MSPLAFFVLFWSQFWPATHELIDEPDLHHVTPAAVHQLYENGLRPAAIAFVGCGGVAPYVGSFNVMMPDDYPFWNPQPDWMARMEWDQTVQSCVQFARHHHLHSPVMVAQGFGGVRDGDGAMWTCPTRADVQFMIASASRRGAAGILFFTVPGHACASVPEGMRTRSSRVMWQEPARAAAESELNGPWFESRQDVYGLTTL